MRNPRCAAMNCSSSEERPVRKRRVRQRDGRLLAHSAKAVTRASRTADLLSLTPHMELWDLCRIITKSAVPRKGGGHLLAVVVVRRAQPMRHFAVDFGERGNGDAVRNAVPLGETAGIDQAAIGL